MEKLQVLQPMPAPHGNSLFSCGQCRWYSTAWQKGKTCREVRGVQQVTKACVEFAKARPNPFQEVESDKYLQELRETVLVDSDDFFVSKKKELKGYLLFRKEASEERDPLSYLDEEEYAKFGHKFEICQGYLERTHDVYFELKDKHTELRSLAKTVESYLFASYRDIFQNLKNETERQAFLRVAAKDLYAALDKMEALLETVEKVQEALRSAHFAMSRKKESLDKLLEARIHSVMNRSRGVG